jgi:tellurite resistance protein TerC
VTRLIDRILRLLGVADIRHVRKLFVGAVGMTVLLIGLALTILPGPACVVIPLGLGILATEFVWARRWLDRVHAWFNKAKSKFTRPAK